MVGPGNNCDYSFRSDYVGHQPDMDAFLAAATGVDPNAAGGEGEFQYESALNWGHRLQTNRKVSLPFLLRLRKAAPRAAAYACVVSLIMIAILSADVLVTSYVSTVAVVVMGVLLFLLNRSESDLLPVWSPGLGLMSGRQWALPQVTVRGSYLPAGSSLCPNKTSAISSDCTFNNTGDSTIGQSEGATAGEITKDGTAGPRHRGGRIRSASCSILAKESELDDHINIPTKAAAAAPDAAASVEKEPDVQINCAY